MSLVCVNLSMKNKTQRVCYFGSWQVSNEKKKEIFQLNHGIVAGSKLVNYEKQFFSGFSALKGCNFHLSFKTIMLCHFGIFVDFV